MKEIHLREYYPFYTQDVIVEVPDEVADLLRELKLADAASFLRTYRLSSRKIKFPSPAQRQRIIIAVS